MIKTKTVQAVAVRDWDDLVSSTYGRPYDYQQQDGCKSRGVEYFTVPVPYPFDFKATSIPEKVNGAVRGVSFAAWLARDPNQKLKTTDSWGREHDLELFWDRNFYPSMDMLINDLHERKLLPAGEYQLVIDW